MKKTTTYVIKRTGRRCTPRVVQLSDGSKLRLRPTGTHVRALTAADAAMIATIPNTRVTPVKDKKAAAAANAQAKVAKAPASKARSKKGKGKKSGD